MAFQEKMKYIVHVGAEEARSCHMSFNQDKNDMVTDRESMRKSRRFAVIVGVNQYEEDDIPHLAGAEYDAQELRKKLIENNFQVSDQHFLLGEHATRTAILKAISDIFHNEIDAELVIFYFSGHGVLDEKKEGYIAPYDLYPKAPFVSGIRMEDLKYAIERSNKKTNVAIILDCCYAGIVTESTRALPNENTRNLYVEQVQKLDEPGAAGAKFILASSEGDEVSREKNDCVDTEYSTPHPHGAFSFYLLKGLAGAAANDDGIITFSTLKNYIGDRMKDEGKQIPISSVIETGPFLDTAVATIEAVFSKKIERSIIEIRGLIGEEKKGNSLPYIWNLDTAVNKLVKLSDLVPNANEISQLEEAINNRIMRYNEAFRVWLNKPNNERIAGAEIEQKVSQGLWNQFDKIRFNLRDYKRFQKLSYLDKRYLNLLRLDLEERREYTSADDEHLQTLIEALTSAKQVQDLSSQGG
jgi:Caspase domain